MIYSTGNEPLYVSGRRFDAVQLVWHVVGDPMARQRKAGKGLFGHLAGIHDISLSGEIVAKTLAAQKLLTRLSRQTKPVYVKCAELAGPFYFDIMPRNGRRAAVTAMAAGACHLVGASRREMNRNA